MLDRLRAASTNWLVRLMLLMLLFSFVFLWGTTGFNSVRRNDVFISGDSAITDNIYSYALRSELYNASVKLGLNHILRYREALEYGIPQLVESRMVQDVLLKEQARLLDIGISKDHLASAIASMPNFQVNGHFAKDAFIAYGNMLGINSKSLTDYYEQQEKNKQLSSLVDFGADMPQTMAEAFWLYQNQKRDIRYITLTTDAFIAPAAPSDDQLREWLAAHRDNYKAPEYRHITTLSLLAADLAHKNDITQEAIKAYYNEHGDLYHSPASQSFDMLRFTNKEKAQEIYQQLKSGQKFSDIARDLKAKAQKDIVIEHKEDATMASLNEPLRENVFKLKQGQYSPVIELTASDKQPNFAILYITKSKAETNIKLDTVKEAIRDNLLVKLQQERLANKTKEIQEAYDKGESLESIAKAQNLTVKQYVIDNKGQDEHGEKLFSYEGSDNLLKAIFQTEEASKAPALELGNKGRMWYHIAQIVPARFYDYSEVKDQIIERWNREELEQMLAKASQRISEKLNNQGSLEDIAAQYNVKITSQQGLDRFTSSPSIPLEALNAIFATPKNKYDAALIKDNKEAIIFEVTDIKQALDNKAKDNKQDSEDLLSLHNYFRTKFILNVLDMLQMQQGLKLNQQAYDQISQYL